MLLFISGTNTQAKIRKNAPNCSRRRPMKYDADFPAGGTLFQIV